MVVFSNKCESRGQETFEYTQISTKNQARKIEIRSIEGEGRSSSTSGSSGGENGLYLRVLSQYPRRSLALCSPLRQWILILTCTRYVRSRHPFCILFYKSSTNDRVHIIKEKSLFYYSHKKTSFCSVEKILLPSSGHHNTLSSTNEAVFGRWFVQVPELQEHRHQPPDNNFWKRMRLHCYLKHRTEHLRQALCCTTAYACKAHSVNGRICGGDESCFTRVSGGQSGTTYSFLLKENRFVILVIWQNEWDLFHYIHSSLFYYRLLYTRWRKQYSTSPSRKMFFPLESEPRRKNVHHVMRRLWQGESRELLRHLL